MSVRRYGLAMFRFVLLTFLSVVVVGCSNESKGSLDAGGDAGVIDAGTSDAGADAGVPDSGEPDAGVPDAGVPDAGTPTYPVYEGCPAPATTFTRTVYADPSAAPGGDGSEPSPFQTLETALGQKQLHPGDHVVLLPGDHGAVAASKYSNPELVGATAWIWLDFQPGATVQSFDLRDMSAWLITHAEVSAPGTTLASFSGSSNMVLADSSLYTVKDASGWTAADWIDTASDGIGVRNGQCIALLRNVVENSRFGIGVSSDGLARPDTSVKALVLKNEVANFSGDAMRVIASDVTVEGNFLHDAYVSAADGDDNHDDALQMWALNGATFDNIRIDGNWVQESTDPTRPFQAELQGITDFDGVNTHVQVTNNVVLVSAYHGISLYGAQDSLIDHNTVANPTANGHKTWIMVNDTKDGAPSVNLTVTHNAATQFNLAETTTHLTATDNVLVPEPVATYTAFDTATMTFDLEPKAGSVLGGVDAGAPNFTSP